MHLFKLKTSWLALILAASALVLHLGIGYLLTAGTENMALAAFWQRSLKLYWPAMGVIQALRLNVNVSRVFGMATMVVAALLQLWAILAAGIWLLRMFFRKPQISSRFKLAIVAIVLGVVVCFYKVSPEALGDPREPLERAMSLGDAQKTENILKSNPALANKPLRFGHMTPLFYAIMSRNPKTNIDLLIKSGADINARSGGFNLTPLQQAAWSGKLEAVKALLAHKPDVNATTESGDTALTYAFVADSKEIFNLLLESGVDINHGRSALAQCMVYGGGRDDWPEFLLSKGADPNRKGTDADRFVPIIQAIINGNTNYVAALLKYRVDLNTRYRNGADDFSPLELAMDEGRLDIALMLQNYVLQSRSNTVSFAAATGDLDSIRSLIARNPQSIEDKDELGLTPLAWAAEKGQREAAELLLSLGADANAAGKAGRRPIDWAATSGYLPLVELLATNGIKDLSGTLYLAIQQHQVPVARFLLEHGANPNIHYRAGNAEMPLHLAAGQGNADAVKLLLEHGADVNGVEQNNSTPLFYAVGGTSKEVVELLFAKGAAIFEKPGSWTILQHWALGAGDTNIAAILLTHGIKINAKDSEGRTALHFAAQQGTLQAVEWLAKNGAEVNAKDNKGVTPLSLTKVRNRGRVLEKRKDVADVLRKYGAKD